MPAEYTKEKFEVIDYRQVTESCINEDCNVCVQCLLFNKCARKRLVCCKGILYALAFSVALWILLIISIIWL